MAGNTSHLLNRSRIVKIGNSVGNVHATDHLGAKPSERGSRLLFVRSFACDRRIQGFSGHRHNIRRDRLCFKTDPFAHLEAVLLAQMTENFHRQSAAVFMAQPPADGGNIHARLDAGCGEKVPEVVMGEMRKVELAAR